MPVYARGGIGLNTAAAAVAVGAAGVVLDEQLSLCKEVEADADARAALRRLDGSESRVVDGERITSLGPPNSQDAPTPSLGIAAAFAARYERRYRTVGGVIKRWRRQ